MVKVYGKRLGADINFDNTVHVPHVLIDTEGPTMTHTHVIPFPNGKGHTPCSEQYFTTKQVYNELRSKHEHLNQFNAEDYELLSRLDDKLANLRLRGHTGTGVRY